MKRFLSGLLLFVVLTGCQPEPRAPSPTASPGMASGVLGPDKLRTAFPKLGAEYSSVDFRAKPGIVTRHARKGSELVATVMVMDLLGDPSALKEFDSATQKVHGYPAISTSMGGGVAVLAEGRFRVEVVALAPEITDRVRARWLDGFGWATMKGWAN